jgi:RimJ/RimL family protein N-acetyltransferase
MPKRFRADWSLAGAGAFVAARPCRGARPLRLDVRDAGGRLLGRVGVHSGGEPEVSCFLDPAASGRGLITAALRAFLGFAFARFDVMVFAADVFTDNSASARVPEKAGFLPTGAASEIPVQRLEPAPVWRYRLRREALRA